MLDSKRSKEENDKPGIANLVYPDNENERPDLTNSESSSGEEEMHLMNNMHETTNGMPDITNSESSSGEEEMHEVIDYSTMPELITHTGPEHEIGLLECSEECEHVQVFPKTIVNT